TARGARPAARSCCTARSSAVRPGRSCSAADPVTTTGEGRRSIMFDQRARRVGGGTRVEAMMPRPGAEHAPGKQTRVGAVGKPEAEAKAETDAETGLEPAETISAAEGERRLE